MYANSLKVSRTDNVIGGHYLTITNTNGIPQVGQYFSLIHYVTGASDTVYQISNVADLGNGNYRLTIYTTLEINVPNASGIYIGSLTSLPTGLRFDEQTGDIYGVVPYQPAITKNYKFTITATRYGEKGDVVSNSRNFNITIIGDVNSGITWVTPSDLGSIPADYICNLSVSATSSIPNATVIYEVVSGSLPPGLTLNPDGEIIGMVNQYFKPYSGELGLILFDGGNTTFDQKTTTVDRNYVVTIQASDQFGYSAVARDFVIFVTTPNSTSYSNITTRPLLPQSQRTVWKNFINNTNIFTPSSIYRANDPSFGVQTNLSMLVYAGIETKEAAAYVGAIGLNHKRKRFQFGSVKKAIAVNPDTGENVYEVIYIQMIDPLESNGKHLPLQVKSLHVQNKTITSDNSTTIWKNTTYDLTLDAPVDVRAEPIITIDSTGYEVSNPKVDTYFPNSISNWRSRIAGTKDINGNKILSERNYLPLWMRSIPAGEKEQLDYTLAVPLCFCRPGTADTILLNIKFSGFDFKNIDYTVDRYIIDSVTGQDSDKYLVFRNDRITV